AVPPDALTAGRVFAIRGNQSGYRAGGAGGGVCANPPKGSESPNGARAALAVLGGRLIAAGPPAATPLATVANAGLPGERIFRTRLDLLPLAAKTALGDGPALLLIGEALRTGCPAVNRRGVVSKVIS